MDLALLTVSGNLSLEWTGALAKPYPGSGPRRCVEGQRPSAEPSLADMTTRAISFEARAKGRHRGFFLQVEGASIDKQDHAENPCGQIGETVTFDRAIAVGWPTPSATLTAWSSSPPTMVVNYATNLDGRSQSHTGTQVRIAAQDPQAANVVGSPTRPTCSPPWPAPSASPPRASGVTASCGPPGLLLPAGRGHARSGPAGGGATTRAHPGRPASTR